MNYENLKGRRVLVAEDEYLIADGIREGLQMTGAEVLGPFGNLRAALEACERSRPEVAILDINLGGQWVFPLADALIASRVPFIFTSGYDDDAIPAAYEASPRFQKPTGIRPLLEAVSALL